ncbi:hypothetical protein SD81_007670 [Tolypothrix campylonemoides VB511288]|nr:hypothetical protein SD81_007670 [Tolypothrix campylonemoides VB511288]
MYAHLYRREPSLHWTWGDRSLNLKNRPTFTFDLILKNLSKSYTHTCAGDRSPNTALAAIAFLTLDLGRSLFEPQKSPNFHL